jgi:hypothetical protein
MTGPRIELAMSCWGCEHYEERSEEITASITKVVMTLVTKRCKKVERIIGTEEKTPSWCPYLPDAKANFILDTIRTGGWK